MTIYTLELEFDINQITRSLQYEFSNPEVKNGILAGTFNFNEAGDPENDILEATLTVTGAAAGNPSVTVTDCTLVSASNGKLGMTYLSPFSQSSAVSKFDNWPKLKTVEAPAGRVKLVGKPGTSLPVMAPTGQWEISGYLSVIINWNGKNYNRVFTFDPESTTGLGNGLGWPS